VSLLHKLLNTESEWNPKVILGRVLLRVLPESAVRTLKKHYYAYLLTHMPSDWNEDDAAAVPWFVNPSDVVVDVGANLGVFPRLLARLVGPNGKVYAFEPIPETYAYLCHNLARLHLPQINPVPVALSDAARTDIMVIPKYRWGADCWYDARIKTAEAKPAWREIAVKTQTLDSFNLPRVSFIKCDANYHELAVLHGAWQTISRDHPAMLIEVNPDPDNLETSAYQTFHLLGEAGYAPYIFRDGEMHPRKIGERSQNYFFLTAEHVRGRLTEDDRHTKAALPRS